MRIPRGAAGVFALLVAASAITCFGPTEVRVEVTSDVPCARIGHVQIEVGADDGTRPSSVTADTVCTDGAPTDLGSLVVVPSSARDARVRVRVVVALGSKSVDTCAAGADLRDCIVATRVHRFSSHRSSVLPIVAASACIGVRCSAGETCLDGRCASADTTDPDPCGASGTCAPPDATADDGGDATPDAATDADAGAPGCRFGAGVTSLAGVARPYRLFVTPLALYVLQAGASGASFARLRRETTALELVADAVATAAASETHEFWVPLGGAGIVTRPAGSNAAPVKLSDIPANPLAAEGDHVFGIVTDPQGEAFYAFSPAGALRLGSGGPFEYFSTFAVADDRLLFGETSSTIRSLPKDASADAQVVVALPAGTNVQQILAARPGSDLYFTQGPVALERYSGGVLTKLATPGSLSGFQLDATDIYWIEPEGNGTQRLMRIARAGGVPVVRLTGLATNATFATDDRCLYWWDGVTTGTLAVAPK